MGQGIGAQELFDAAGRYSIDPHFAGFALALPSLRRRARFFAHNVCTCSRSGVDNSVAGNGGIRGMIRTILLGSRVSVQGYFVQALADGRIAVRVGQQLFYGFPV